MIMLGTHMSKSVVDMASDEKLIELVRENEALYDLSHKKYMDSKFKNEIWIQIGIELTKTAQECKLRWNNIRDTYRRWLKKSKSSINDQGFASQKKYKYADQLSFLQNYFQEKETIKNVNRSSVKITKFEEILSSDENDIRDDMDDLNDNFVYEETKSEECIKGKVESLKRKTEIPLSHKNKKPKKSKISSSSLLIKYILKKSEESKSPPQQTNPVDSFLVGISPILKSLSPYYLNLAKSKIFSVVQEFELKMIMENQNSSVSAPLPTSSSWAAPSQRHSVQDNTNYQGKHFSKSQKVEIDEMN